jgi:hypothetical protein
VRLWPQKAGGSFFVHFLVLLGRHMLAESQGQVMNGIAGVKEGSTNLPPGLAEEFGINKSRLLESSSPIQVLTAGEI